VDRELVDALLEKGSGVLVESEAPFAQEHSLETQLPFIQKALPSARIVPIMVGRPGGKVDEGLVDLLFQVVGDRKDVVVVASTDLSHYEPYDQAVAKDGATLDRIASLDWASFASEGPGAGRMCGFYTVGVLLGLAAKYGGKAEGRRIKYLNSGDTAGSRSGGVVGYGVVAVTLAVGARTTEGSGAETSAQAPVVPTVDGPLTAAERMALLNVARQAASAAIDGRSFKPAVAGSRTLKTFAGALVNLRVDGRPRGSGGGTQAQSPLFEAVAEAAQSAVVNDVRYPAPAEGDLASLQCEVVVIFESWALEDVEVLDPAVHGLIVTVGESVAYVGPGEGGWTREKVLAQGCRRAGLSPTCFRKNKKQEVVPTFLAFSGVRFADWDPAGSGKGDRCMFSR
jgi:AMMECR1 domain-containing protein